ncbi:MAG: universal stress protein [Acidobacteria bacterium]|nr:MAG: universal stress protein [Acidobacteriota bacterium]
MLELSIGASALGAKEGVMETFQPRRILCPTDFSELATFALKYAREVAQCFHGRLLIMYADPFLPPPHFTARQVDELVQALERSKMAAREALADYVWKHVGDRVETESLVVEDWPVPAILRTAEERDVDLIVMGTHGRRGLSRVMLGSVTERVLRETDRPVLTVRYKQGAEKEHPISITRILCPVNFTDVAMKALGHAVSMARCFDAQLVVLNVVESPGGESSEQEELDRLCAWVPGDVRSSCHVQEMVRRGHAAEQIIDVAASIGCDLIVLGAQHRRFSDTTVIGTTTERVTRHAPCPVLTVIRR